MCVSLKEYAYAYEVEELYEILDKTFTIYYRYIVYIYIYIISFHVIIQQQERMRNISKTL